MNARREAANGMILECAEAIGCLEGWGEGHPRMGEIAQLFRKLVGAFEDVFDELEAVERELANVLGEEDNHE